MNNTNFAASQHSMKIVLCGESGAGKSTLLYHYINDGKPALFLPVTINYDYKTKEISFNGHKYLLKFWDTCGQERYGSITQSYFRDSHAIILVYDVTKRLSFERLDYWLNMAKKSCDKIDTMFALVGNKLDLKNEIVVQKEEADRFAQEKTIPISLQVSAYTGKNVYLMFDTLAYQLSTVFSSYLATPITNSESINLHNRIRNLNNIPDIKKSNCSC